MSGNESIEAGRSFIQSWLADLSPEERETLDSNFRECLPKLQQIEAVRSSMLNNCHNEPAPDGFQGVLASIDEIADFEHLVQTVGIDPENLTAGDVVAIALEWLRQQKSDEDPQKVVDHIRELRFQPSKQTALNSLPGDAMMNHVDIAAVLNLQPESLRTRLERWRKDHSEGWQENQDASGAEPRFVYRIGAIRAVLMEAIVASYRSPIKVSR